MMRATVRVCFHLLSGPNERETVALGHNRGSAYVDTGRAQRVSLEERDLREALVPARDASVSLYFA